jgi:hypothetical protein
MRDLIKKVLREAVGVPSGIYETTIELYKKINKSIDDKIKDIQNNFTINNVVSIP